MRFVELRLLIQSLSIHKILLSVRIRPHPTAGAVNEYVNISQEVNSPHENSQSISLSISHLLIIGYKKRMF